LEEPARGHPPVARSQGRWGGNHRWYLPDPLRAASPLPDNGASGPLRREALHTPFEVQPGYLRAVPDGKRERGYWRKSDLPPEQSASRDGQPAADAPGEQHAPSPESHSCSEDSR